MNKYLIHVYLQISIFKVHILIICWDLDFGFLLSSSINFFVILKTIKIYKNHYKKFKKININKLAVAELENG